MKELRAGVAAVPMSASRSTLADFVSLTKPRLNVLVVATSAGGYYLGAPPAADIAAMSQTVVGIALVAAGAAVLNQVMERDSDALMRRTRHRALPDGRIPIADARLFGLVLSSCGVAMLAVQTHLLAAALALATSVIYLAVYTPLKRRTPLSTVVGAVPGALPPLIGWAAARGEISFGGAALFAIVFLWQIPHFMAIAWMHRDDYAKARFPMLSVVDPSGRRAGQHAVLYAAALIPVSTAPTIAGVSGTPYLLAALCLGIALFWLTVRFAAARTDDAARRLFLASIVYLPLLWIAMIVNRM